MSQHLYECERCSKYGVAHYILERDETAPLGWRNVLVCTACFRADRKAGDEHYGAVDPASAYIAGGG